MSHMQRFPLALLFIAVIITGMLAGCGSGTGGGSSTRETATVSGNVLDKAGAPVAGAVVAISGNPLTALTGENGNFSAEVEPGEHMLTIRVKGKLVHRRSFTCETDVPVPMGGINTIYNSSGNAENAGSLVRLTNDPGSDEHPYWSPDGDRIVFHSDRSGNKDIWVMDANGAYQTPLTTDTAEDERPNWSPDGDRIVFHSDRSGNKDIWVMDAGGNSRTQLTDSSSDETYPCWSPDGSRIAFQSNVSGNEDIWTMNTDGTVQTQLTTGGINDTQPVWSPDGTSMAFSGVVSGSGDIWVMSAGGSDRVRVTDGAGDEQHPDWSPDGSKLVFSSDRKGSNDIWTINKNGSAPEQVTTNPADDRDPDWSPDGMRIAFTSDSSGNKDIWIFTFPLPVKVDIMPGSIPNSLEPETSGVVSVAILTGRTFDASDIDPLLVALGPEEALETHGKGHIEDADGDGDLDLVLHFEVLETGIRCGDTEASLTGRTYDGTPFTGSDSIITVSCN